jgi:hypothetical protein
MPHASRITPRAPEKLLLAFRILRIASRGLRQTPEARIGIRAIEGRASHEPFSPGEIAAEINRRFAPRLGWEVDVRQISMSLRWMAGTGRTALVERGHQGKQSRYVRAED